MPPRDPTLSDASTLTVAISALTVHAAFCRLWISPPSADGWQDPKAIATGGDTPRSITYDVARQTLLAWRVSVGSPRKRAEAFRIAVTLSQHGQIIQDGVLLIEGKTGGGGTAMTEGYVTLL